MSSFLYSLLHLLLQRSTCGSADILIHTKHEGTFTLIELSNTMKKENISNLTYRKHYSLMSPVLPLWKSWLTPYLILIKVKYLCQNKKESKKILLFLYYYFIISHVSKIIQKYHSIKTQNISGGNILLYQQQ